MAEINKLSVGKALDKLRGTDVPASKMARLDEEIDNLNKETQRLRATRVSIEHGQRVHTAHEARESNIGRITKPKAMSGMIVGIVIMIAIVLGTCWLFWP